MRATITVKREKCLFIFVKFFWSQFFLIHTVLVWLCICFKNRYSICSRYLGIQHDIWVCSINIWVCNIIFGYSTFQFGHTFNMHTLLIIQQQYAHFTIPSLFLKQMVKQSSLEFSRLHGMVM